MSDHGFFSLFLEFCFEKQNVLGDVATFMTFGKGFGKGVRNWLTISSVGSGLVMLTVLENTLSNCAINRDRL